MCIVKSAGQRKREKRPYIKANAVHILRMTSRKEWGSGLCACLDRPGQWAVACIIPCFTIGENVRFMNENKLPLPESYGYLNNHLVHQHHVVGCCYATGYLPLWMGNMCACAAPAYSACSACSLLQLLPLILHLSLRTDIKAKRGIHADRCGWRGYEAEDICAVILCPSCAMIQERKEVEQWAAASDQNQQTNSMLPVGERLIMPASMTRLQP